MTHQGVADHKVDVEHLLEHRRRARLSRGALSATRAHSVATDLLQLPLLLLFERLVGAHELVIAPICTTDDDGSEFSDAKTRITHDLCVDTRDYTE